MSCHPPRRGSSLRLPPPPPRSPHTSLGTSIRSARVPPSPFKLLYLTFPKITPN